MSASETVAAQRKEAALPPAKPNGKGQPVLMPERFNEAEFKAHFFIADAEANVQPEQVLEPAYWAHVAAQMDPFDHITVRAEDGTWIAFLIVVACERNYARVVLDRVVRLVSETSAPVDSIKHKAEWKGPFHKWCVIRTSDSQMVHSGDKTKFEAETWLRNHERGMEK